MVVDNRPNNASRLLAVLIRHVKDDYSAIISYSDEVVGHKGTIYTALGAIDLGKGKDTVGFKMADGRIISGRNASYALLGKEEEAKVIRIPGKHKFLLVTDAKNKEKLGNLFK
jgi:hypothetical protein